MKTTALLRHRSLGILLAAIMCFGMMQTGLVSIAAAPAICSHEYKSVRELEPTCTEKGTLRFSCTKCTYSYTNEIEPIGHTNDLAWITDDEKETMWHKCVRCDHTSEPLPYVAPLSEPIGFTYADNNVYLNGEWHMKAGANYYDAFTSIFTPDFNLEKESVQILRERFQMIKDYNIPYIRFNALGYARAPLEMYHQYSSVYYTYMDFFIQLAAEYGIGLVPSLFWEPKDYPEYFGENGSALSDPDSETSRFIHDATDKFLTRYLNYSNIFGWEFGNEYNLYGDTSGAGFSLKSISDGRILFANIVRELDPYRIISSGDAIPCTWCWSYYTRGVIEADSYAEVLKAMEYLVPEELDTLSIHFYEPERDGSARWYNGDCLADVVYAWKEMADTLDVALYIGEYGGHVALFSYYFEPNPPSYDSILKSVEMIKVSVPEVLNACARSGVGLTFYWSLWSYPFQSIPENVITPDSLGTFVLDYLKAYNDAWDNAIAGDITGNGRFDARDITAALRELATPGSVSYDESKIDANGDGEFSTADVIVMMRALAGWEGIPLKHYVQIDYVP